MLEIMKNTMESIFAAYLQYAGSGMYMLILFASLLYIYIAEHNLGRKYLLCYYPLLVIAVIFNPLVASQIISIIEGQVYWRVFWILPITIVIAYAAASIISNISKKTERVVATLALMAILIMGGKFMFTSANYSPASNWYKLPPQTIEVCDILEKDCGGMIRVVVPEELLVSMRQYDANIQMAYGRTGADNSGVWNDASYNLYCLMQDSILKEDLISKAMKELDCNYIVLNKSTFISDKFGNYGYHCIASTDSYNVYWFNAEEMNLTDP